jgi:hypothetical protein
MIINLMLYLLAWLMLVAITAATGGAKGYDYIIAFALVAALSALGIYFITRI